MDDDVEYQDVEDVDDTAGPVTSGPADSLVGLVTYMVTHVVDDPDQVTVSPQQFGSTIHIRIRVPEEEMGRVIGRQGRIARSMRTLLTVAASRKGLRASLDIDS